MELIYCRWYLRHDARRDGSFVGSFSFFIIVPFAMINVRVTPEYLLYGILWF
jgi:hypothetical protein